MIIDRFIKSAVDIHCHGIGSFDFTEIQSINFQDIEDILAKRGVHTILTLYLYQSRYDDFLQKMEEFSQGKVSGRFKHIVGIGLEGPLLASFGGTPSDAVWSPSKQQWQQLSRCGKQGLIYVIYSPDFPLDPQESTSLDAPANNVTWIAETLLSGGYYLVLGIF